ncbi:MAG TPA: sulfur oxidation c-type cytochrome SoxX [Usitatibacteraceae bacterium]|nr:sulfur oxidation c-type cytochrome SoxX [Usitatibacteraceae bacterium]
MRFVATLLLAGVLCSFGAHAQAPDGRALFIDAKKGNCLACHQVPGEPAMVSKSNIGPPLSGVAARGHTPESLRELLADPTRRNPASNMPPYGRHRILTEAEIEAIVRYVIAL